MKESTHENYPWWMVAGCSSVGLAIYAIGFYLTARLGIGWGLLYLAYCLGMEWRLLSGSCRQCYYYGKRCGFGKGRVCAWFFDRRQAQSPQPIAWWNVVPDFLVSLVPLGIGVALLLRGFSWLVLVSIVALLCLASVATGYVRSQLACKHCKQRELGCAAEQLFGKTKQA